MAVFAEFSLPPPSKYTNVVRWYNHIDALLKLRYAQLILIQNSLSVFPLSSRVMFIFLNDVFIFSGVTAAGQGVKVESSIAPEASTSADTKGKVTAITFYFG
jgi:elongation factor 1-beta